MHKTEPLERSYVLALGVDKASWNRAVEASTRKSYRPYLIERSATTWRAA